LFAVSILLAVMFRQLVRTQRGLESLVTHIERAILVLKAMDDCQVAKNAATIIKRTLARARKVRQPALTAPRGSELGDADNIEPSHLPIYAQSQLQDDDDDIDNLLPVAENSFNETAEDLDWLNTYSLDESQQALFWTEWAHNLDTLGMPDAA
jgi:hypothetical protein